MTAMGRLMIIVSKIVNNIHILLPYIGHKVSTNNFVERSLLRRKKKLKNLTNEENQVKK